MAKIKRVLLIAFALASLVSTTFAGIKVPDKYVSLKAGDERIVFFYYPTDVRAARYLAELAPQMLKRIGDVFDDELKNFSAQIIVAHSLADYKLLDPLAPSWSVGRAYPELDAIIMLSGHAANKAGLKTEPDKLLAHELFHLVMHERVHTELPRYFEEGVARYLSGEMGLSTFRILSLAIIRRNLIPLGQLVSNFPLPPERAELAYAESESFVWFLADRYGPRFLGQLFSALERNPDFAGVIENLTGKPLWNLESMWRSFLTNHHTVFLVLDPSWFLWWVVVLLMLCAGIYKIASSRRRLKKMKAEELAEDIGQMGQGGKITPFGPDFDRKRDKAFKN